MEEERDPSCKTSASEERVQEWETGLPSATDLTPLSQYLISPELASAFSITAEPFQTMLDVNRASQNTISSLRRQNSGFGDKNFKSLCSFMEDRCGSDEPMVVDEDEVVVDVDGVEKRKIQSVENVEEADSALRMENLNEDCSARTLKRARLVWTPQLHKRFVDVVGHLGIDNAVPKTIMQMMNVEGLTRENVASHLQKYRLFVKRQGPASSDQLFASTPTVPQNMPLASMPYVAPMQPMPMHMGMSGGGNLAPGSYSGFEFHPYGMSREHQGHWPGNKFGPPVVPNSHVSPNNK
ncbi:hypothetical protein IFM89_000611 [Coptis chinensis]|uniref:HTH myb-type domain-containing protein n=1 Tax=Coptis chinensis TaxID=261450 RepID=A0A835LHA1_9MAGN|nr:hypothetical protein IFM89_000611 [Coptis chinensis]